MTLALHPACSLFPALTGAELDELAADIKVNGLLDPIVLHEGQILDGRNRHGACVLAGVEPRFREWAGEHGSPTSFVLATNLLRRHLTPSQRAAIGAEALPQYEAEARERQGARNDLAQDLRERIPKGRASEQAGAAAGVNERYVREAAAAPDPRGGQPHLRRPSSSTTSSSSSPHAHLSLPGSGNFDCVC